MRNASNKLVAVVALSVALDAARVHASDGVIEINQTCAAVGCLPGDAGGFPITLAQSGSYRLTSDIGTGITSVPVISIGAQAVTLDLNGFTVEGGGPIGGAAILGGHRAVVRNGFVKNSAGAGVLLGGSSRVRDLHVYFNGGSGVTIAGEGSVSGVVATGNSGNGITAGDASLVEGCTATANGADGINLLSGSARGNTSTQNAGSGAKFGNDVAFEANAFRANGGGDVVGGHASGGNVCGDRSCTKDGRRRFYLTIAPVPANAARSACAAGFHMANFFEMSDPSLLAYDRTRGRVLGASSPPTGSTALGWVQTGGRPFQGLFGGPPGRANCVDYTGTQNSQNGTVLWLPDHWGLATQQSFPWAWAGRAEPCDATHAVWCVED